jgi:menaquinone-dependent protoporphyrinogen IX oxidase
MAHLLVLYGTTEGQTAKTAWVHARRIFLGQSDGGIAHR